MPVRFREALQRANTEALFITNFAQDGQRCLELWPPDAWQQLIGRVRQKNSFNPKIRKFQTFYIGGAHEVQLDAQGRILVPPKLREFARLDRDVTFSALTDHFQLWDKRILERILADAEESVGDPKFLEELDL